MAQLQALANHSWEAARTASDVLQEMKRLKTEMKMLLTVSGKLKSATLSNTAVNLKSGTLSVIQQPGDPPKATRPTADHLQSQQNQSYQTSSQENPFWSQSSHFQLNLSPENHLPPQQNQSQFRRSQFHQNQLHEKHLQLQTNHQSSLRHTESQQNPTQSQLLQSRQTSDGENKLQSQSTQSQQSQSLLVQSRPVAPSLLEEAGQVLRHVRKQKKVLEENLEALLRARTGEVLHCQLEALAANR